MLPFDYTHFVEQWLISSHMYIGLPVLSTIVVPLEGYMENAENRLKSIQLTQIGFWHYLAVEILRFQQYDA